MRTSFLLLVAAFAVVNFSAANAETTVFSGPQVGEKFPSFAAHQLVNNEGKAVDLIKDSGDDPVLLIFFHERTRPAFGLTNAITRYAATRKEKGLHTCVVFLTDDHTEMRTWSKNVAKHLTKDVLYTYSADGKEGPGIYGLNREVKLTILVGKKGKVTANFAIGQPQLEVDGPAILKAITDVTGGGKVPEISEIAGRQYRGRDNMRMNRGRDQDPKLTGLLRGVINKRASDDEVAAAAKKVEAYIAENAAAKKELTRIVTTVVNSGKLSNYGTESAQAILKDWAAKLGKSKPAENQSDE